MRMNALVKASPESGIELLEVARPQAATGEALVSVLLVGICGTDLSLIEWKPHVRDLIRLPRVLGHEFVGRVESAKGRPDLVGAIVTADTDGGCGDCSECRRGFWNACLHQERIGTQRDGALAPLVAVPVRSLVPVPVDMDERISCLLEPMAAAVHAVSLLPNFVGKSALVIGPGPVGVLAGIALLEGGASPTVIVGVPGDESRLDQAEGLGLRAVTADASGGTPVLPRGEFDVVLDAVGTDRSMDLAVKLCRTGGDVSIVGLGGGSRMDIGRVVAKQLHLHGSWRRLPSTWPRTIEIARRRPEIASLVQVFEWSDYVGAFEALKTRAFMKVAIRPPAA